MVESSASPDCFDVAIVGYGPTGATLAHLLALHGLSVLVLEREAGIYQLPRAVHFDDEVMRTFALAGITDELVRKVRINPGMQFVDRDGTLLMDWPRPPEPSANGWHPSYRFHQPDLESLLREALNARETVAVRAGVTVDRLLDRGEDVEIRYLDGEGISKDGSHRVDHARYVVGCDGARSFVRGSIGAEMEDLGFDERWLVVDMLLRRPMPELGDCTVQHCDPVRPITYCRSPENRRRWEIKVTDEDDVAELAEEDSVWRFLKHWIKPEDAVLERRAIYTFQSAVARTWRAGRVLLAGDAAHLTPPFMGQGMCAGIRDAVNLAWKLAACLKKEAPQTLLDTYQSERRPHVREYIETAIRLGALISKLDRQAAADLVRASGDGHSKMKSILPRLGPGLAAGDPRHSGRLFPNPLLDERRFDDIAGMHPVLVSRRALSGVRDAGERLLLLNAERYPVLTRCLDELGTDAVLVRPDKYIFGTARTDDELRELADFNLARH